MSLSEVCKETFVIRGSFNTKKKRFLGKKIFGARHHEHWTSGTLGTKHFIRLHLPSSFLSIFNFLSSKRERERERTLRKKRGPTQVPILPRIVGKRKGRL